MKIYGVKVNGINLEIVYINKATAESDAQHSREHNPDWKVEVFEYLVVEG